jgi:class 3 adenylate cyclase/tetratricopeptide (TPR) repeat protein
MTDACQACGTPLPGDARFCPRCGALSALAPTEERKLVTVLFADLVGSTELGRRLDPERAREVQSGFLETLAAEIASARGQVEKFIGDAVLAVFGIPRVHEDDAVRAVRAGLAIIDAVDRLGQRAGLETTLSVRVGIETGEVAAGQGPAGQLLVTGTAVNAAARLQEAATPGEVLIGETTRLLIGEAAVLGAARSIGARGFDTGLTCHPVTGLARRSVRRTIPIVGRGPELTLLHDALERATRTGRPHLFTVIGEAGMGKSRLIDEFAARLPQDVLMLVGRAESHGATTLGPIADMLRRLTGVAEGEHGERIRRRLREAIAARCAIDGAEELAERLAFILGVPGREHREEAVLLQDAQRAFATLIEALAARGPLVLVLDDIHLARAPVLDLVERFVARKRHASTRALVAVSGRQDLLDDRPAWGSTAWNHTLVRLEPLDAEESDDLVRRAAGGRVSEETAQQVVERSGGNPFFIVETTGMLLDAGGAASDRPPLPPTVQAVVAARLDHLPTELRDLARRTSVFLDSFDLEELALIDPPDRDALSALEEAEVLSTEDGSMRWRFCHQILHDVAYAGLPKRQRLQLHLAVADGLDRTGRPGGADHLERAALASLDLDPTDRTVPDRAAAALLQAGDRARRRMEPRRAVDRFRRALALAGPPAMWGVREARALAGIGEARYWLAEYTQASEALGEAERLGLQTGDAWTLAHALRFLGDVVLNVDADVDRAEVLFARSLQAAEDLGDPQAISRSLLFSGWVPWTRDRFAEAEAIWQRALSIATETGDRWVQARTLTALSVARAEVDDLDAEAAYVERALAVARDLGDQFSIAVAMVQMGRSLRARKRQTEAIPFFTEAAAMFEESGVRWELADALYARGSAYEELGRLDEAETDLRVAVRLCEELGARALARWTTRALARVRGRRDDWDSAAVPAEADDAAVR